MRAKSAAIAIIALCGAYSPPFADEAAAAQQRRDAKQARSALPSRAFPATIPGVADPTLRGTEARLSGSRSGAALAAAVGRRQRAEAAAAEPGGISCVPYARLVSGIQVTGNGGTWWNNAAGLYDRDQRPAVGSVLAFPASGGMARGHVAVVQHAIGAREIEIEHANWAAPGTRKGQITRNVSVIDVSDRNDWTQVRVETGGSRGYGRVYPTHGFIHNRPEGAPGRDTPRYAAGTARYEEVAEAPMAPRATYTVRPTFSRGLDLSVSGASLTDAGR